MLNRRFGVELEFDSNGLGTSGVGDLMRENGFGEDWTGEILEEYEDYYGENVREYSAISEDGSEVEVRTPILEGKKGFKELERLVKLLNSAGCYTTEADGLHVHHDSPEFIGNKPLIIKLLKSWKYNEVHIVKFVDEARADWSLHETYESPCPTFSYEAITAYENLNSNHMPGYPNNFGRNNLNINALREHGSIEFRLHEGTLYWPEIEAWILFGQSFLNGVISRKNPIMPADNPVVLMNRLKTNPRAKTYLRMKAGMAA